MSVESNSLPVPNLSSKEKDLLFDTLTKDIPYGIALLKGGVIKYCNDSLLRLSGFTHEELLDKKYDVLFDEENLKRINQLFSEIEYRKFFNIEIRLKSKETDKPFCILNAVLAGSIGKEQEIICTISDITERKKTEEKLRQSEEFHSTLLNAISESLIGVDSSSKIVLFNTAAKILFKRSSIECIGQSPEILFFRNKSGNYQKIY